MTAFILPDLGEGLKDAELVEWLVKEGQSVILDELVLLVETAKAVVELPAPSSGIITRLAVRAGETVKVGQVLFEYEEKIKSSEQRESISVVGELSHGKDEKINLYEIEKIAHTENSTANEIEINHQENKQSIAKTQPVCIAAFKESRAQNSKADKANLDLTSCLSVPPKTMAFAKKLGLQEIFDHTYYGELTLYDLLKIYQEKASKHKQKIVLSDECLPLTGARKVMAQVMTKAHQEIPSATLFEDADISHWNLKTDFTLKIIKAISVACSKVPIMNAWYDADNMTIQQHKHIDLGLAVNSERGLFVPVIRQINSKKQGEIRADINNFRNQINEQSILAKDLTGATISLSNFGVLSGRYATPIIVPPQVCIVGIGKSRDEALVKNGKIQVGRILPISLSFDHRAATGAEAALFMQCIIQELEAC